MLSIDDFQRAPVGGLAAKNAFAAKRGLLSSYNIPPFDLPRLPVCEGTHDGDIGLEHRLQPGLGCILTDLGFSARQLSHLLSIIRCSSFLSTPVLLL
jgi:hypothetical protein